MKKYKIFAGLSGGFGGASKIGVVSFSNEDDANTFAYETACDIYDSHAGSNGLPGWGECQEEALASFDPLDHVDDDDLDMATEEIWNEHRENWITYYAEIIDDEDDNEDEYDEEEYND